MNTPKRQHFIPQVHLKNFIGADPRGQVWTYDSQTGKSRSATPDNTAVESHFYSAESPDGTMDTNIETLLSDIESEAAPVYRTLLAGNVPHDEDSRIAFASFLATLYTRTPAMRRMHAEGISRFRQIHCYAYGTNPEAFDALVKRYEKDEGVTLDAETRESVRNSLIDPSQFVFEIPKERTLSALMMANTLLPIFLQMHWQILEATEKYFITTDNPVVRQCAQESRHPFYGDGGFMNKTVEVVFPLSPTKILLMTWQEVTTDLGRRGLDAFGVDTVNALLASQSDRFLYASISNAEIAELAKKYRDSRPGMTTSGMGPKKFGAHEVRRRSKK